MKVIKTETRLEEVRKKDANEPSRTKSQTKFGESLFRQKPHNLAHMGSNFKTLLKDF